MKRAIKNYELAFADDGRVVIDVPAGAKPLHVYTGMLDDTIWMTVEHFVETSEPSVPHLIRRVFDSGSILPIECERRSSQFVGAVEVFPGFLAHIYWCDMLQLHEAVT